MSLGDQVYDIIAKHGEGAGAFLQLFADEIEMELVKKNQRTIRLYNNRIIKNAIERAESIAKSYEDQGDYEAADAVLGGVYEAIQKNNDGYNPYRLANGQFASKEEDGKGSKKSDVKGVKQVKADRKSLYGALNPDSKSSAFAAGQDFSYMMNDAANANKGRREMSSNDRTYNAMRSAGTLASGTGQLMSAAGVPGGQAVYAAGEGARLTASLGTQGEKLVGPAIRRAQYRSQGVERRVDTKMKDASNRRSMQIALDKVESMPSKKRAEMKIALAQGKKDVSSLLSPSDRTEANQMASVEYLTKRVPKMHLNSLREQSGKIAPSEGIILDADGNVAHQSVGVAEDHYLPFSSENLKNLKGGSYIRTRTSGGLTTEDLRTGMRMGARSMTVVSNSGVFRVDFDDDFVGNARNSSRAKQMIDRYGKLLDAVQSEQVSRAPLSASEKLDIEDEVDRKIKFSGGVLTSNDRDRMIADKIRELQSNPRLTPEEEKKIEAKAKQGFSEAELSTDRVQAQVKRIQRGMRNAAIEAKGERTYKLNGRGYQDALTALQDEFPYFINVHELVKPDDAAGMNSTDSGYVKARHLHPEKERHGYFDESITGSGKMRGDQSEYQNWSTNVFNGAGGKQMRLEQREASKETKTEGSPQSSGSEPKRTGSGEQSDYKERVASQERLQAQKDAIPKQTVDSMSGALQKVGNLMTRGIDNLSAEQNKAMMDRFPTMKEIAGGLDNMTTSKKAALLTDYDSALNLYNEATTFDNVIIDERGNAQGIAKPVKDALRPPIKSFDMTGKYTPALPLTISADERETLLEDGKINEMYREFVKNAPAEFDKKGANEGLRASLGELRSEYANTQQEHLRNNLRLKITAFELARRDIHHGNLGQDIPESKNGGGAPEKGTFRS